MNKECSTYMYVEKVLEIPSCNSQHPKEVEAEQPHGRAKNALVGRRDEMQTAKPT